MDMTPSNDFPPIPKCFSHLVVVNGDGECHGHRLKIEHLVHRSDSDTDTDSLSFSSCCESVQNPSKETDVADLKCVDVPFRSTAVDQSSNQCYLTKSTITRGPSESHTKFELDSESSIAIGNYYCSSDNTRSIFLEQYSPQPTYNGAEYKNPFLKLNSSLTKLQKEMKDLRFLDVSLFCQLTSLQDSIQDLKLTMSDRYSETGSEFSLGTASYMGSMSSLNEESDWGEDGPTEGFDQNKDMDFDASINENQEIASDLLKQITDLALRAEEDF